MAMPTAMPEVPFTRRLGTRVGRTVGSWKEPSKLGTKSTVSFSMSLRNSSARAVSLTSVYLMAAGGSPSRDPKFPWPSTKG